MTGTSLPLFVAVLVFASAAVTWAVRLTPPRVSVALACDREVCGDEPREFAHCGTCDRPRLSAMHADGAHTCLTCLTTTAGDQ